MSASKSRSIVPSLAPIVGSVVLPGSKSDSARAILAATLSDGVSRLAGVSASDDTRSLLRALDQLGVRIERLDAAGSSPPAPALSIEGGLLAGGEHESLGPTTIDVGLGGTTARFLLPVLAATPGLDVILSGEARLRERPMADLLGALQRLGADIEELEAPGRLPLRIRGRRLAGGELEISGRISSQFLSGLLLASPLFEHGLSIEWTEARGSQSYVDLTCTVLRAFGRPVAVTEGVRGRRFEVAGGPLTATDYSVDGDASGASYFWSLAAVTGGRVTVENLRHDTVQGDLRFVGFLERMGCQLEVGRSEGRDWVSVEGPADRLQAIEADLSDLPDTAQTLAVVACFAEGTSTLRGLHSLPYKETDRLAALVTELERVGIEAVADDESINVVGGSPHGARVATYRDHRMAMAFAVLGARVPEVTIESAAVVSKSFPDFWERLEQLGVVSHAGK